jgi:hypothetical protein
VSRRLDWSRTKWEHRYSGEADPIGPWKPSRTSRKPLPIRKLADVCRVGARVYNRRFGEGEVLAVANDGTVTVLFRGRFKKTLRYEEAVKLVPPPTN